MLIHARSGLINSDLMTALRSMEHTKVAIHALMDGSPLPWLEPALLMSPFVERLMAGGIRAAVITADGDQAKTTFSLNLVCQLGYDPKLVVSANLVKPVFAEKIGHVVYFDCERVMAAYVLMMP